ncbi:hypothetical protein L1049_023804 [Liquidambar formosana]|uniref:Uncharacterized protein n=1 Tax=Liquidambar formosana TaxID=63359 RepID=A0AAP0RTF7_LIQFO
MQEAKRKKNIKRVERKMAAVARERAWAQRLAELQQIEEEKKKSMAWETTCDIISSADGKEFSSCQKLEKQTVFNDVNGIASQLIGG